MSVDSVLGLPYNIASYALLLMIITELVNNHFDRTHVTNYKPGKVIMILGDTHVYSDEKDDHVVAVKEQLSRGNNTYKFPTLKFKKSLKTIEDIENMSTNDIELINYISCSVIKAQMYA